METKKERTFEEFLREFHGQVATELGVHHRDWPDHFDHWLGELDGEEYIKYADLYGKERYLDGAWRRF
jgi:hypothetical protein